jgi:hypothetical protein
MIVCGLIAAGGRDVELRIAVLIWPTRSVDDPRFICESCRNNEVIELDDCFWKV